MVFCRTRLFSEFRKTTSGNSAVALGRAGAWQVRTSDALLYGLLALRAVRDARSILGEEHTRAA